MKPRSWRLSALLCDAGVRPATAADADPVVSAVCLDSRRAVPGSLFVAVRGFRADGESFVDDAVRRGAVAVVGSSPRPSGLPSQCAWVRVEDPRRTAARLARSFFRRPDESLRLVGITGTNGKTTVTYLVEAMGAAAGRNVGRVGTLGWSFGGAERASARTTPEATDLFALLAEMRETGVELVAMEVSSHALALGRTEGARFEIAAFLNLGRDHLDFHGDVESYFEAKVRLFEPLDRNATAVLSADDPRGREVAGRTAARVVRFGRSPAAEFRLENEICRADGSEADLRTPLGVLPIRTSLAGRFNLENVAAAAACAISAGCGTDAVVRGAAALAAVPGRMQRIDAGQPFAVLVDFAHTDAALERLLHAVREVVAGRLIVVFGCGGERDRGKRRLMGRIAAALADEIVLTSDNPRGEDPREILGEILSGVADVPDGRVRCRVIENRRDAVAAAFARARPDDAVVIAGKGAETTQSLGDAVIESDDREIARSALAAAGFPGGERALA